MYVIDVIPLSRTAPGVLSYRSAKKLPTGTIVSITVRKTATQGIVISSLPVQDAKEMLKHARFLLSKSTPAPAGKLPSAIMRVAEETAAYHATSVGAVLAAVFAEHIRLDVPLAEVRLHSGTGYAREMQEAPLTERVQAYEKTIRDNTKRGTATLLVVPTLPEVAYWKEKLASHRPIILSGAVTGARRAKALEAAVSHTGLILATPSFSWVPIARLGAILIERPSAGTYVLPKRPYLSMVRALDALAKAREIPLVLGDFPVPLEFRAKPGAALHGGIKSSVELIDARRPKDGASEAGPWRAIPDEVIKRIHTELVEGGSVIALAVRKGYAPGVVCRDCGQAQTDERGMPLSFTMAGGKRLLTTSDGATALDANRACQRCGSWNLLPLGIGIERVEEELKAAFPDVTLTVASSDVLMSQSKAKKAVAALRPGTVLVGTEAVLPWLRAYMPNDARAPLGIIASADSLLALPFWRARERFVRLSYFLAGMCRATLLVTRHPEDAAVNAVAHPESVEFWKEETALRKALNYPPFGTLITLTLEGPARKIDPYAKELQEELAAYAPALLPNRTLSQTIERATVVLTLPEGSWPDQSLAARLRNLPPTVRVRIDPEAL